MNRGIIVIGRSQPRGRKTETEGAQIKNLCKLATGVKDKIRKRDECKTRSEYLPVHDYHCPLKDKNCNIVSKVRVSESRNIHEHATESDSVYFVDSYHRVKKEPDVSIFRKRFEYSTFFRSIPSYMASCPKIP